MSTTLGGGASRTRRRPRALHMALELVGYETTVRSGGRRQPHAGSCSAWGSARRSTLGQTTSARVAAHQPRPAVLGETTRSRLRSLDIFSARSSSRSARTPQGQGHERTGWAQVVSWILGCDVDIVHVRAWARQLLELPCNVLRERTRASSRSRASEPWKGSDDELAGEPDEQPSRLARSSKFGPIEAIELRGWFSHASRTTPQAAPPCFMALARDPRTRTTPGFLMFRTSDSCRASPLGRRSTCRIQGERKFGNLTLTYAMQDPRLRRRG